MNESTFFKDFLISFYEFVSQLNLYLQQWKTLYNDTRKINFGVSSMYIQETNNISFIYYIYFN